MDLLKHNEHQGPNSILLSSLFSFQTIAFKVFEKNEVWRYVINNKYSKESNCTIFYINRDEVILKL